MSQDNTSKESLHETPTPQGSLSISPRERSSPPNLSHNTNLLDKTSIDSADMQDHARSIDNQEMSNDQEAFAYLLPPRSQTTTGQNSGRGSYSDGSRTPTGTIITPASVSGTETPRLTGPGSLRPTTPTSLSTLSNSTRTSLPGSVASLSIQPMVTAPEVDFNMSFGSGSSNQTNDTQPPRPSLPRQSVSTYQTLSPIKSTPLNNISSQIPPHDNTLKNGIRKVTSNASVDSPLNPYSTAFSFHAQDQSDIPSTLPTLANHTKPLNDLPPPQPTHSNHGEAKLKLLPAWSRKTSNTTSNDINNRVITQISENNTNNLNDHLSVSGSSFQYESSSEGKRFGIRNRDTTSQVNVATGNHTDIGTSSDDLSRSNNGTGSTTEGVSQNGVSDSPNRTGSGWPSNAENARKNSKSKTFLKKSSPTLLHVWMYRISLVFWILCFVAVVAAMPIDMIIQSQRTGQFWNAIIIICAYALMGITATIITITRIISTKRSLATIPHQYAPGLADVPIEIYKIIKSELNRCREIARNARPIYRNPPVHISHDGLMPPSIRLRGRLADTSYIEVVRLASEVLASKAQSLHPSFDRSPGMPLRGYMKMLHEHGVIDASEVTVDDFVEQYERARYSGKLISEAQFAEFMEAFHKILLSVRFHRTRDNKSISNKIISRQPSTRYQYTQPSSPTRVSISNPLSLNNTPSLRTVPTNASHTPTIPLIQLPPLASWGYQARDPLDFSKNNTSFSAPLSRISTTSQAIYFGNDSDGALNDGRTQKTLENALPVHSRRAHQNDANPKQPSGPIFRDPWGVGSSQIQLAYPSNRNSIVSRNQSVLHSPGGTHKNSNISTTDMDINTDKSVDLRNWNSACESSHKVFVDSMIELARQKSRKSINADGRSIHSVNSTGSRIVYGIGSHDSHENSHIDPPVTTAAFSDSTPTTNTQRDVIAPHVLLENLHVRGGNTESTDISNEETISSNQRATNPLGNQILGNPTAHPQLQTISDSHTNQLQALQQQQQIQQLYKMKQHLWHSIGDSYNRASMDSQGISGFSEIHSSSSDNTRKQPNTSSSHPEQSYSHHPYHFPHLHTSRNSQPQSSSSSVIIHPTPHQPNFSDLQSTDHHNPIVSHEFPYSLAPNRSLSPEKPSDSRYSRSQSHGTRSPFHLPRLNHAGFVEKPDGSSTPNPPIFGNEIPSASGYLLQPINVNALSSIDVNPEVIGALEKAPLSSPFGAITTPSIATAAVAAAAAAEYSTVFKNAANMVGEDAYFQVRSPLQKQEKPRYTENSSHQSMLGSGQLPDSEPDLGREVGAMKGTPRVSLEALDPQNQIGEEIELTELYRQLISRNSNTRNNQLYTSPSYDNAEINRENLTYHNAHAGSTPSADIRGLSMPLSEPHTPKSTTFNNGHQNSVTYPNFETHPPDIPLSQWTTPNSVYSTQNWRPNAYNSNSPVYSDASSSAYVNNTLIPQIGLDDNHTHRSTSVYRSGNGNPSAGSVVHHPITSPSNQNDQTNRSVIAPSPSSRLRVPSKFRSYAFNKTSKSPALAEAIANSASSKASSVTITPSHRRIDSESKSVSSRVSPPSINRLKGITNRHPHLPHFSLRRHGSGVSGVSSFSSPKPASKLSKVHTPFDDQDDNSADGDDSLSRVSSSTGSVLIHR